MIAMKPAYPQLMEAINDLRRQWRARKVIEGILLTLAGVALVLVLVVAADNLFKFSPLGRMVLAVILWGSLIAGVTALIIRRILEDRRDDFFAAMVEEKHPELHNQFINALQLGRGDQFGSSALLIDTIVRDAAEATAELEMSSSIDTKPLKMAAGLAALALLLVAGYATALSTRFSNGLQRVLLPAAEIAPYTATRLAEVTPGSSKDNKFPEGSEIVIKVRVEGEIPATAQLVRSQPDGERKQTTVMQPDKESPNTFLASLRQYQSFDYFIEAGDARSDKFPIEIVKLPQIDGITLNYAMPAYAEVPPTEVVKPDGEISAIPGTEVKVRIKATKPLKEAFLIAKKGEVKERYRLTRGDDDATWQRTFLIWDKASDQKPKGVLDTFFAPTMYQIAMEDTDGYQNAEPLWRPIALAADQPPTVSIPAPGRDQVAKPEETIPLTVEARDDFGLAEVQLMYRLILANGMETPEKELRKFPYREGPAQKHVTSQTPISLTDLCKTHKELKLGGTVQYWAVAVDRNDVTKPGKAESRRYSLFVLPPADVVAEKLDLQIDDYIEALKELVKLQTQNRAQTYSSKPFADLIKKQAEIRTKTNKLARAMEGDGLPVTTIVKALDNLYAGLMVDAIKLFELGRDTGDAAKAAQHREDSLPVQDKIIAILKEQLERLQKNEQAKEALRKLEAKDKKAHKDTTDFLTKTIKDLDQLLKDQTDMASKFERLPKKPTEETKEDKLKDGMKELEEMQRKWEKWAKGSVNEMTKLPEGFIDDFKMRKDVNKIFEEIEKAAQRAKTEKLEVSLEDLGAGLATKMKEDLEMWLPDNADALKWVLEEPLNKKNMKIPEMPLPKALEDIVGDLLQKADEFDQEADDVTSAWGDNLDQAGWGVTDGPISFFSAKGKTGNDLPNNMELTGRSGDGRRGKSTGQMVGDTARGLQGRKTPARVSNERYEPGQLKQEGSDDPNGATGGGKKAGSGRKGLQGGTPPDLVKDIGRLSEKQAGIREKAEQVAKKLDTMGIGSSRLQESIRLMKELEGQKDFRYEDNFRKRKVALGKLRSAFAAMDKTTARQVSGARELPAHLRDEMLQSADEGYPPGYENLLKNYYKALSNAEK